MRTPAPLRMQGAEEFRRARDARQQPASQRPGEGSRSRERGVAFGTGAGVGGEGMLRSELGGLGCVALLWRGGCAARE